MELLNPRKVPSSTARLVMVLPLAALLGCLVGWLAFKQLPPPIIELSVKARGENVMITWPAEQTRGAIYAAVRVDDSTPVPLTLEEKSTGRVEVQARPDMKVELISRNWIRDSRGIVHYVRPLANTALIAFCRVVSLAVATLTHTRASAEFFAAVLPFAS